MENDIEYNKYQESCDDYKGYHYPSAYLRCVCYKIYYQRSSSERGNHAEHEVENGASSGETAYLGFSALEHEQTEHEERGDENCPENIGSQRWRGPFFAASFVIASTEDELIKELLLSMSRFIWAIARPNRVLFVISR